MPATNWAWGANEVAEVSVGAVGWTGAGRADEAAHCSAKVVRQMPSRACRDPADACLELEIREPLDDGGDGLISPKGGMDALDLAGD
jgi:hypothetical protein